MSTEYIIQLFKVIIFRMSKEYHEKYNLYMFRVNKLRLYIKMSQTETSPIGQFDKMS